jgi:Spy/CpxP family protein refolding chaperone
LKEYLSLSDAQVTALRQVARQESEALKTVSSEMRQKQTAMRQSVERGGDPAAIGRLALETSALNQRIRDTRKRYFDEAVNTLTAEQKTRLKALEDAARLAPAIRQAMSLNLITPPEPPAGAEPMGFRGPGGPGPGMERMGGRPPR